MFIYGQPIKDPQHARRCSNKLEGIPWHHKHSYILRNTQGKQKYISLISETWDMSFNFNSVKKKMRLADNRSNERRRQTSTGWLESMAETTPCVIHYSTAPPSDRSVHWESGVARILQWVLGADDDISVWASARATLHMPILSLKITSTHGTWATVRRKWTGKCSKIHTQETLQLWIPFQYLFYRVYLPLAYEWPYKYSGSWWQLLKMEAQVQFHSKPCETSGNFRLTIEQMDSSFQLSVHHCSIFIHLPPEEGKKAQPEAADPHTVSLQHKNK